MEKNSKFKIKLLPSEGQNSKLKFKIQNFQKWMSTNRYEFALLVFILILATLFRLWRIDEYLPFLGDEGRDVRVVRRFVTDFDLMFIGPRTSIGDMYLGPLFYYLIAPGLLFANFSPAGPATTVALFGVATVFLIWRVAREWFGREAAIISSFLFAISPLVVNLSKHSWNPNIMPFFALLSVYSIWRVWSKGEYLWFLVLGGAYAFVLQSHYLGLLLGPVLGLSGLLGWLGARRARTTKSFLVFLFSGSLVFIVLMSPLFIFDSKHGWHNTQAIATFFTKRQETVSVKPWNAVPLTWPIWKDKVVNDLLTAGNQNLALYVALGLLLACLCVFLESRRKLSSLVPFGLTVFWILVGLLGLGSLKQNVYSHYFGFMFPAVFLLIGAITGFFWKGRTRWVVVLAIAVLITINLQKNPLFLPPQRQMQRVQEIDKKILKEADSEPFNFALIAKRNYEEGYLYFFELWNSPVREINAQNTRDTLTEQLFVVCEDPVCEPINNAKAEIANFGWAKIESEEQIGGVKLYKLVHTKQ
ncbi:MAG: glycosyltransferase family 39 protein [Candidatus Blackburnbacteria bacterium]|nr:glycosyltransferase family 39 protein [Candidatus Blackburnbacteria bacterium]